MYSHNRSPQEITQHLLGELIRLTDRARIRMEELPMNEIKANCLSSLSEVGKGGVALLLEPDESGVFRIDVASDALPFDGERLKLDPGMVDPSGTLPLEAKAEMMEKAAKDIIDSMAPGLDVFAEALIDSDGVFALLLYISDNEEVAHAATDNLQQVASSLRLALIAAKQMNHSLKNSNIDPATGFFNRRYLEPGLRTELARASRYGHTFSLVCFQPDHPATADEFTREIAKLLKVNKEPVSVLFSFRNSDIPLRTGKNQFMIMLPETPKWGALTKAERFRKAVKELPITGSRQSISMGVATFPEDASDDKSLLNAVTFAMDQALKTGGDRVVAA